MIVILHGLRQDSFSANSKEFQQTIQPKFMGKIPNWPLLAYFTGSSTTMFRYDEGLKLMVKGKVAEETFPEIQSVLTEQIRISDTGRAFQNKC